MPSAITMGRPLRIEYSGTVYRVTSRCDRREPIARDDVNRALFLDIVGQALERFDAQAELRHPLTEVSGGVLLPM